MFDVVGTVGLARVQSLPAEMTVKEGTLEEVRPVMLPQFIAVAGFIMFSFFTFRYEVVGQFINADRCS
jgi:hypothetical protein